MSSPPSAAPAHQALHHRDCNDLMYAVPPPDEPLPSYDDATNSSTSPLLVGPPPDYGAFRAYVDPDESSEASSEADDTEQYLPDRIGQAFAVCLLIGMLYLFWRIINQPEQNHVLYDYS